MLPKGELADRTRLKAALCLQRWLWSATCRVRGDSENHSAVAVGLDSGEHGKTERNGEKYHEKTLALAGDRQLWFNTHFQPSGCFSRSGGVRSVRGHSSGYPDRGRRIQGFFGAQQ